MSLLRSASLRQISRARPARVLRSRVTAPQWQLMGARRYASSGGAHQSGSDLPWIIGAALVAVPGTAWILSSGGGDHGGGHHGGDHHGSDAKDHKEEDAGHDAEEDKEEGKEEEFDEQKSDDDSKDEEKSDDSEDGDEAKGKDEKKQKQASPTGSSNNDAMANKQEGLSNTDTKHSNVEDERVGSKKGEGASETAKLKGTVQPDRPQK